MQNFRLNKFQDKLEHIPAPNLVRLLIILFCLSIFLGSLVASVVKLIEKQKLEVVLAEMKKNEKMLMDLKLEKYKSSSLIYSEIHK